MKQRPAQRHTFLDSNRQLIAVDSPNSTKAWKRISSVTAAAANNMNVGLRNGIVPVPDPHVFYETDHERHSEPL